MRLGFSVARRVRIDEHCFELSLCCECGSVAVFFSAPAGSTENGLRFGKSLGNIGDVGPPA